MIIVIGNVKGGTGKSCLSQNVSVGLALKYNKKILLVDADPQETSADWIQSRKENEKLTNIHCIQLKGNIRTELLELEDKFDCIIVDCGGHDSGTMRSAMATATHILIPFRAKRRDLKLLPQMSELIELIQGVNPDVKINSIITQAPSLPSQVDRILEAKAACESFELPALEVFTYMRNVYDDADEAGASVFEHKANKSGLDLKAIAEIEQIIAEFIL